MENCSDVWPGATVFSPRMIKSSMERLPTTYMEVGTMVRDGCGGGGNDKQERLPPRPSAMKASLNKRLEGRVRAMQARGERQKPLKGHDGG